MDVESREKTFYPYRYGEGVLNSIVYSITCTVHKIPEVPWYIYSFPSNESIFFISKISDSLWVESWDNDKGQITFELVL